MRNLNSIKVRVFFGKSIEKKHLGRYDMIRIIITFANQIFM